LQLTLSCGWVWNEKARYSANVPNRGGLSWIPNLETKTAYGRVCMTAIQLINLFEQATASNLESRWMLIIQRKILF